MTQPSTSTIVVSNLADEFTHRHGFSISPTLGASLTPAEVHSGDFVVEGLAQQSADGNGVLFEATLANGQTIAFPPVPEVMIYR